MSEKSWENNITWSTYNILGELVIRQLYADVGAIESTKLATYTLFVHVNH